MEKANRNELQNTWGRLLAMEQFFKIRFMEDDKGKIHMLTDFLNQDKDGFFITINQQKGMFLLLEKLIESLKKNDLESLR